MDPLPPTNKVFSLITQEERQRKIGSHSTSGVDSVNIMAFATKHVASNSYKGQKTDCPYYTHCQYHGQYHGHTVDKCYKLYGYPPGFKPPNNRPPITQSGHKSQSGPGSTGHNHSAATNQFSTSFLLRTLLTRTLPLLEISFNSLPSLSVNSL